MKPLMMMRTRGLSGPAIAEHAGTKGLSKSTGNAHIPGLVTSRIVPDVTGLTEAAAIIAIEAVDLVANRIGVPTIGTVDLQIPLAGTVVRLGATVNYRLTG